jgi:glutamyl-tRNA reductase|uniref:Glutamyl-tRNA reductase n=1 Tax=Desulfobacca acetoxidans TaxID=60893 RepID=A0A7V6A527_9BACT
MNLILAGVNHQTARVDLREKLCSLLPEADVSYPLLLSYPGIREVLFYTTCNRVEVLCVTEAEAEAPSLLSGFFASHPDITVADLAGSLYLHRDQEAVRHLFRVAASLDALVVGEPQILGQVKSAYRVATEHQATGPILNKLLHKTFSVAKRVRTETGIGDHAVSVSYAAVALGKKIFGDLKGKHVLMLGAGEMAELALEHLQSQGAGRIVVANRTLERGVRLAERFGGQAVSLEELESQLLNADVLLSSTGSASYLLTRQQVRAVMRRRRQRPLFMIDIGVPRDLDPAINDLDNVYLYNIDDLKEVVDENLERRKAAAVQAERLVAAETLKFMDWLATLSVYPTIISLKEKAQAICQAELKKTLGHIGPLTPEQEHSLAVMTEAIINKLLHDPIIFLKGNHHRKRGEAELALVRRLFNLDPIIQEERPDKEK